MGQPVVLPKFELPGDRPHWAVRAAWIVGGLLLVSIVGLGAIVVHHRNLETEAQIARAEAIAKVKADADAKVAMAAAQAKARREAELAAVAAAHAPAQPSSLETGDGPDDDSAGAKAARANRLHRGRSTHGAKTPKTASKPSGRSDSSKSGGANKPDAIDELLKKMK